MTPQQDDQFKRNLARRNLTGNIGRGIFYFAIFVAFFALGLLVYTIVREAFGVVAESYTTKPNLLAQTWLDEDKPFEEMTEAELAFIATKPYENDKPRLRILVMEQVLGIDTSDTAVFREKASQPVSELLEEGHYPSSLADKAIGNPPLEASEYSEIMELNMSREELEDFVIQHVAGLRVVESWPLNTVLLDYDSIEATVDNAEQAAADVENVSLAGEQVEELATSLDEAIAAIDEETTESNIAELATETAAAAEALAQQIQRDAELANYVAVTEQALLAAQAASLASEAAAQVSELAESGDFVGAAEAAEGVAEQAHILATVTTDATTAIRSNPLVGAELKFRSWVNFDFLSQPMSTIPELAGIRTALLGSIWLISLTILMAFPLGVGAAIYLEEYADDNMINRLIQTNITNLAGVPSIIYGILGLAIFVRVLEAFTSGSMFGYGDSTTANGRTIISGSLTMALLILPIIIINGQEAIRSVPNSLRQASYGLGATQWQTIWFHVLPNALPGILTGTILAVSRAIGETAPLIVVGAATYIVQNPTNPFSKFTVIPIQIYRWTSEPADEFRDAAAAAIVVLLVILLSLNSFAIILRNRFSRR